MARLNETPWVDPTSRVVDSTLGPYTEVMAHSHLLEVDFGAYSYCAGRNEIAYSRIGKFANIASGCRICPTNHPYQRASLHHFMYRASNYWDDAEIKPRFPARIAERLLALAWWDWDHAALRASLDDFRSLPVEAFLEKYERA